MKRHFVFLLFGIAFVPIALGKAIYLEEDEDATLTVPELIVKYGYEAETHTVTTEDGYILTLHRIPRKKDSTQSNGKVAFVQHGILASSADWIISGPEKALAYLLADEGYDVWLGNNRGNHYSRNHTTLNPDTDGEFWDFSWHQIGNIDIPTMIDYVLSVTNQTSLFHIGHSQGTTTFYIMTSEHPEYNDKIKAHISLAPIAFMNHMATPLMPLIAPFLDVIEVLAGLIGLNEFLPSNELVEKLGDLVCGDDDITQPLCENILFLICGFSPNEMNGTLLPIIMGHTPAGSSRHQLVHYAQEYKSGHFRQYDYGLENMFHYGSLTPPNYQLDKITSDIYLLYSQNDWMAAEKDVERLADALPNLKAKLLVSDGSFNHLDFTYGISARQYVYNEVISLLARYD